MSNIGPLSLIFGVVRGYRNRIAFGVECTLFVFVVFTVVFSISELSARESVLTLLQSQISLLKSDFVEQNKVQVFSLSAAEQNIIIKEKREALNGIQRYEELKRELQSLIALGSDDPGFSLRSVVKELNAYRFPEHNLLKNPGFFSEGSGPLPLLSSDQLLAIAVIGCGAIGAMIASLRNECPMSLRIFVVGISSGFVAYLAIKGGRHLFLLQTQGEIIAFNPYGSAFAGILSGLFTERAHQLLSSIVDDFVERVKNASNKSKPDI